MDLMWLVFEHVPWQTRLRLRLISSRVHQILLQSTLSWVPYPKKWWTDATVWTAFEAALVALGDFEPVLDGSVSDPPMRCTSVQCLHLHGIWTGKRSVLQWLQRVRSSVIMTYGIWSEDVMQFPLLSLTSQYCSVDYVQLLTHPTLRTVFLESRMTSCACYKDEDDHWICHVYHSYGQSDLLHQIAPYVHTLVMDSHTRSIVYMDETPLLEKLILGDCYLQVYTAPRLRSILVTRYCFVSIAEHVVTDVGEYTF